MTNEQIEAKIRKLTIPIETQIMMSCDTQDDTVLLAVAMLRKVITIFDTHYNPESRKALIEQFNK
jgi:polyhydroxyalkanoate synthesis regulator protein